MKLPIRDIRAPSGHQLHSAAQKIIYFCVDGCMALDRNMDVAELGLTFFCRRTQMDIRPREQGSFMARKTHGRAGATIPPFSIAFAVWQALNQKAR